MLLMLLFIADAGYNIILVIVENGSPAAISKSDMKIRRGDVTIMIIQIDN
jgi:hypothetical protein